MAKFDISFDSVTKKLDVFMDGMMVPETEYVSFETYDGTPHMNISLKTVEHDGVGVRTNLFAKHYEDDKKKKKSKSDFSQKHYILSMSDGHYHYYVSSSPFTSTNDGHFHGVVDGEVISSDDHTHSLIELDSVANIKIEVKDDFLGKPFSIEGGQGIYFKSDGVLKLGTF